MLSVPPLKMPLPTIPRSHRGSRVLGETMDLRFAGRVEEAIRLEKIQPEDIPAWLARVERNARLAGDKNAELAVAQYRLQKQLGDLNPS